MSVFSLPPGTPGRGIYSLYKSLHNLRKNMEDIDSKKNPVLKPELDTTTNTIDQYTESLPLLKHGNQKVQEIKEISNSNKDLITVKGIMAKDLQMKIENLCGDKQDLAEDSTIKLEANLKPEQPKDIKPEAEESVKQDDSVEGHISIKKYQNMSKDNGIKTEHLLENKQELAENTNITLERNLKLEQPKKVEKERKKSVKHDESVEGHISVEKDQNISKNNGIKTENLLENKHDLAENPNITLERNLKSEQPKEVKKERKESVKHDGSAEGRVSFEKDHIEKHYDRVSHKRHWILGAIGRLLGLEFAPINIPISRRLETFGVTFWMSTFLFMGFGSLCTLVYIFFFTKYWWVSLCYLTWYLGDRSICNRGGRRLEWVRRWQIWKHMSNFFPVHLIKTVELDPSRNYIMGYHPHGILSAGAFVSFATEGSGFSKIFPGFTPHLLTLAGHFHLPFYRELFLSTGAVSATRESMDYLLGREGCGRALCLVVGGAKESLDCHPKQVILHLSKRKGFCKMALRHGCHLVPTFSFGENDIYDQVHNPEGSLVRRIQNLIQKVMGLAPCLFLGRGVFQYSFGIVPYRHAIYTVVGAPIEVSHIQYPTKEQIVQLHAKYVEAVKELYNKYKNKYAADPSVDIQIV